MKKIISSIILAFPFISISTNTLAEDPYLEASRAACEHMKICAKQKMKEIPPEYQEMIEQSLASMCLALPSANSIPAFGPNHQIYTPAIACMKSITSLSCAEIDESGGDTPECEKLSNM